MKKGFNFLFGILLLVIFSSCLDAGYEPVIPTEAEELMNLQVYLKNLHEKGTDIDTTTMGNYYVMLEEGEGELAQPGDTLTVGYAGYFIDGNIFDASEWHNPNDGTFEFILGVPPMIKGWDDGMLLMNKNSKLQIIVPSVNAYGKNGAGSVPAFTTLVFVIKMVDIKPSV